MIVVDQLPHTPGVDISDEGLELDRQWLDLSNNVCGVLHGCRDASVVAARFVGAGWSSRSSSWYGYELELIPDIRPLSPAQAAHTTRPRVQRFR